MVIRAERGNSSLTPGRGREDARQVAPIAPSRSFRPLAVISVLLAVSLALPELADARHKRPKRRNSIATFAMDGMPVPASGVFTCGWSEAPLHDYLCSEGPGARPPSFGLLAPFMDPRETRPPNLLQTGPNYPHRNEVEGWGGNFPLASPNIAPQFSCRWAEFGEPRPEEANWRCSFNYDGHTHRFLVSDIASVSYEPSNDTQQWFAPCDGVGPCPEQDTAGPHVDVSRDAVRLTRRGVAKVRLICRVGEVSPPCSGRLRLSVKGGRRLGSARFSLTPKRAERVRVKLARRKQALVVERRRVRVRAEATARDRLGNREISVRRFVLTAGGRQ
jgi:hypothetical protein